MLENTEKLYQKKLKESKENIDMIMNIIKKFWRILQKQILDPYQRRFYFDKNSPEENDLKTLLKENDHLRSNKESKIVLLQNLGQILELCCPKMIAKQESDKQIYK